ncbi:MAG: hypothetical protein NC200_03820 [Candidatus Gastranaerophilales bacterium]|nr:hypothetical protein [Candidatus Gastranaerophilales bacterium]
MTKKCNKFEALFTFSDEKTLMEHIEVCEDCRAEYEEMNKVSALIKEVKPHYKKSRFNAVRVACILFAFVISGVSFHVADMNYGLIDTVKYGNQFTAEELGFQTDDYGLMMVGE